MLEEKDVLKLRKLFPVTNHCIFLNNAAESPLNNPVADRLSEFMKLAGDTPHLKPFPRKSVQPLLAQILGGRPDEYALVTSTGLGIGTVAAGYDWQSGDNIVVPADEHWNNTFPWLALRQKGVDVRLVPMDDQNRVSVKSIEKHVDDNTRMLAIAAVRHNTGFRADVKQLGNLARRHNALFVVDGVQAAGMVPVNVEEEGIDVLACAGFKWLLGMHGTGFLYIKKKIMKKISPVLPGMFAAEDNLRELKYHPDARRYETGTLAYSLFHAWTAGLELILEIGVDNIYQRVMDLTDHLIKGLKAQNISVLSPVEHMDERSAIITMTMGSDGKNRNFADRLKSKNIVIATKPGVCRISPNFYNTHGEIADFLDAMV